MTSEKRDDVILKHPLSSRLFHWSLVFSFLPAVITGLILWTKLVDARFISIAMRIHIISAGIMTFSSIVYTVTSLDRVVAFIRNISHWDKNDLKWMLVGGGYVHKMFLNKEIEVPPMGKMNSGQKSMGVIMLHGGVFLMFSGWLLYAFIPVAPKEFIYWIENGHLWIGLFLSLCTFAHIFLGIYNWAEFKCMFGNGTVPLSLARHHNPLWVKYHVQPVNKDAKSTMQLMFEE